MTQIPRTAWLRNSLICGTLMTALALAQVAYNPYTQQFVGQITTTHVTLPVGAALNGSGTSTSSGRWTGPVTGTGSSLCFGTSPFVWCGLVVGATSTDGSIYAFWDVPPHSGNVTLVVDIEISGGTGTANIQVSTSCVPNGSAYSDNPSFSTPVTGTVSSSASGNRTAVTFNNISACNAGDQEFINFTRKGSTDNYTGSLFFRGADLSYNPI